MTYEMTSQRQVLGDENGFNETGTNYVNGIFIKCEFFNLFD